MKLFRHGTIAHSLIRPAHLAPCHDIRYTRCLPKPRLVIQFENKPGGIHVWERSVGVCLSIVKLVPWHHPVVRRSLIHRSDPLTWPQIKISVTLGALLSRLVRPIRDCTWWY